MNEKTVKAVDDIIFEKAGITIPMGTEYKVEAVNARGVIICHENGDRYLIDHQTFEAGFEAVS